MSYSKKETDEMGLSSSHDTLRPSTDRPTYRNILDRILSSFTKTPEPDSSSLRPVARYSGTRRGSSYKIGDADDDVTNSDLHSSSLTAEEVKRYRSKLRENVQSNINLYLDDINLRKSPSMSVFLGQKHPHNEEGIRSTTNTFTHDFSKTLRNRKNNSNSLTEGMSFTSKIMEELASRRRFRSVPSSYNSEQHNPSVSTTSVVSNRSVPVGRFSKTSELGLNSQKENTDHPQRLTTGKTFENFRATSVSGKYSDFSLLSPGRSISSRQSESRIPFVNAARSLNPSYKSYLNDKKDKDLGLILNKREINVPVGNKHNASGITRNIFEMEDLTISKKSEKDNSDRPEFFKSAPPFSNFQKSIGNRLSISDMSPVSAPNIRFQRNSSDLGDEISDDKPNFRKHFDADEDFQNLIAKMSSSRLLFEDVKAKRTPSPTNLDKFTLERSSNSLDFKELIGKRASMDFKELLEKRASSAKDLKELLAKPSSSPTDLEKFTVKRSSSPIDFTDLPANQSPIPTKFDKFTLERSIKPLDYKELIGKRASMDFKELLAKRASNTNDFKELKVKRTPSPTNLDKFTVNRSSNPIDITGSIAKRASMPKDFKELSVMRPPSPIDLTENKASKPLDFKSFWMSKTPIKQGNTTNSINSFSATPSTTGLTQTKPHNTRFSTAESSRSITEHERSFIPETSHTITNNTSKTSNLKPRLSFQDIKSPKVRTPSDSQDLKFPTKISPRHISQRTFSQFGDVKSSGLTSRDERDEGKGSLREISDHEVLPKMISPHLISSRTAMSSVGPSPVSSIEDYRSITEN